MYPNAVMTAFHYVQSLQEGDTETAGMLANAEPRPLTLLIDVADRSSPRSPHCPAPTRAIRPRTPLEAPIVDMLGTSE
jgi:hypothetical protein